MKRFLLVCSILIEFFSTASAQWQVITDLDSSIYGIYFTDDTTGYICGRNGIIRKTKNAGDSWTSLNSGTTERLDDIVFVNDSVGFACSYYGSIFKTSNSGETWTGTTVSGGIINELNFPTDSIGYAIPYIPFNITQLCYKTTDQGNSWSLSGYLNFGFDYQGLGLIYGLDFPTPTIGYAIGQDKVLFKTTDGGLNWIKTDLDFLTADVSDIDFTSADTGFLANSDGFGSYPHLYKTGDGGTTWTSLTDENYNKIYFLNRDTAYAAYYTIWKTIDGGDNWNDDFDSGIPIVDMMFPSDSVGYAVSDAFFGPGQILRLGIPVFCNADFTLIPDPMVQGLYWGYNLSQGSNLEYTWDWGDGSSSEGLLPDHTYADSGYYNICLTIHDTITSCTDSFCENYFILKPDGMMGIHEIIFVDYPLGDMDNNTFEPTLHAYPNPFSSSTIIQFSIDPAAYLKLELCDLNGRKIKLIADDNFDAGNHEIVLDRIGLSAGVYLLKFITSDNLITRKLVVQ